MTAAMHLPEIANRSAGLGWRRSMGEALLTPTDEVQSLPDFLEIAPENWIGLGGRLGKQLRAHTERFPFAAHGLSLSIGGPAPLDNTFLLQLKQFLDQHQISLYSEHLSYCSDDGHLYDLMPIPFTEQAVRYVAERIRHVQEVLQRRLVLENVSFYAPTAVGLAGEMDELSFINAVLQEADCELLLDVNNVYVNSVNHRYDPVAFIQSIDSARVRYYHVAGHYVEAEDLIVDTHGADVVDPVWSLLTCAYQTHGVKPTLLERDFNIPPLALLMQEVEKIRHIQVRYDASVAA